MENINISKLFKKFQTEQYCLIKLSSEFPNYKIGSDFDIFCYNRQKITEKIVSFFNPIMDETFSIDIHEKINKTIVDVKQNKSIYLRFDLYGALPQYQQVKIRDCFFSSIIENYKKIDYNEFFIKVPSDMDDLIVRFIEYHEWFVKRPDKIKHIEYITNKMERNYVNKEEFLDKLHYYVQLPDISEDRKIPKNMILRSIQFNFQRLNRIYKLTKEHGLGYLFTAVLSKVKSK
jgi:hypothetical protein